MVGATVMALGIVFLVVAALFIVPGILERQDTRRQGQRGRRHRPKSYGDEAPTPTWAPEEGAVAPRAEGDFSKRAAAGADHPKTVPGEADQTSAGQTSAGLKGPVGSS